MGRVMRTILIVLAGVFATAGGAFVGLEFLWPAAPIQDRPALVQSPPLKPVSRTSTVVAPATITIAAIQKAMESAAPRNLSGDRKGATRELPIDLNIGWVINRGPLAVAGRSDGLTVSTALNGTLRASGVLGAVGNVGGQLGGALGNVLGSLGGDVGKQVQGLAGKAFDQNAELRGNVVMTARPTILPAWRIAPNLSGSATISDVSLPVAGLRLSVSNEVKPLVDKSVRESVGQLEQRVRSDPSFENTARAEWAKLCKSFPLGAAGAGAPNLWLEIQPTRAIAAQPRIDAAGVNLLVGVEAQTRIVSAETKPVCPFPNQIEIVPQLSTGKVSIGVPIDIPFTEVNKLLKAQLVGKTFPEDKSGSIDITIRNVEVAATGEQLLISLAVNAHERSIFSFGTDATIHVYGKPQLDRQNQILRLTDIELDINSAGAFGLVGTAARAAIPYLKPTLQEKAVVDLKPFAADARKKIEAVLADFQKSQSGVKVSAKVEALRLESVAFDNVTLRVIAEAEGNLNVAVSELGLP
jgi:hypothetical protein